jgi:tetratricopeptide (TPR) repeat protein
MSDLPVVSIEMQRVLDGARKAGDPTLEGRALTALAEVALLREGDLPKATELVDAALDVLTADGRFGALEVRGRIAWWVGDFATQERMAAEALEIAQSLERKDLEAHALNELASSYRQRWRLDEAEEAIRRSLELAQESGSILARAQALHSLGTLHLERRETELGHQSLEEARALFAEVGDAWMLGRTLNSLAWAAEQRGDDVLAERLLRDAIRLLKPLEDRGALCESQRALAEALIRVGRLDEAEAVALEAVETVGEHDLSSRATTGMSLGLVRAAQGRDEEAEALLRDALAEVEGTFRGLEVWILSRLEEFLRARDRDEEADGYAERRAALAPADALGDAFATRMERIR